MPLTARSAMLYRCACDFPGCTAVTPEFRINAVFASRAEAVVVLERKGWRQVVSAGRQKAIDQIAVRGGGEWRCPACVASGRAKEAPLKYGG